MILKLKDENGIWISVPAIIGPTGPSGPSGISMTLLWTNTSPTSSFAAQTIALDLSAYDAVFIIANSNTSDFPAMPTSFGIIGGGTCCIDYAYACGSAGLSGIMARVFIPTSTGVEFEGGYIANFTANYNTADNLLVPQKIYGIKGAG